MNAVILVVVGLLLGASVGLVFERLPLSPVLQGVAAAVLSYFIASIASAVFWGFKAVEQEGIAAVSFGLAESALILVATAALAFGLHLALSRAGSMLHPVFAAHKAIILGLLGGGFGAALGSTANLGSSP